MRRRVVVTGLGCVTPFGNGWRKLWENLCAGRSAVSLISSFDTSNFRTKIAAEIKDFDIDAFFPKSESRRMERFTQLAAAAARLAVEDSAIDLGSLDKNRFGVCLGTGFGGISIAYDQLKTLIERGPSRVSPLCLPMLLPNMAAGVLSILFGACGPNETLTTACASSSHAIAAAFGMICSGKADIMICGGSEAPVNPFVLAAFSSMRALSSKNETPEKASSPFDKGRDGFVLGEGSGILILEELEHAKARGAEILAEMTGEGSSADAYHVTLPHPDASGAENAMRAALADAGITTEDISAVCAHGTGTAANDAAETKAIKALFGERAYRIPVNSVKSMTGHMLGAAAAIEAISVVCSLRFGIIPPTINLETPDPECDLDYVPNFSRKADLDCIISNSFGFGGQNSALVFRKYS